MASPFTREELLEQLRQATRHRGGVKSVERQGKSTKIAVEYHDDAGLEASANAFKRELAAMDNPNRIVNVRASRGYRR